MADSMGGTILAADHVHEWERPRLVRFRHGPMEGDWITEECSGCDANAIHSTAAGDGHDLERLRAQFGIDGPWREEEEPC
jgi:hypothetical protein